MIVEERSDLVLLQTCGDNQEATVLKSRLEAEGIFCVIQGENHRAMLGMMGSYIELRVLVPENELERARNLTVVDAAELEAEALATAQQPGAETVAAPAEEDPRAARRRRLAMTYIALFWILPVVVIVFAQAGACQQW